MAVASLGAAARSSAGSTARTACSWAELAARLTDGDRRAAAERAARVEAEEDARIERSALAREMAASGIPAPYAAAPRHEERGGAEWRRMASGLCWGLVLLGPPGVGKTDLAACVALAAVRSGARGVRWEGAATLAGRLRSALDRRSDDTPGAIVGRLQRASLLVVDDLGKVALRRWDLEQLWAVVDHRQARGLPTVLTGNDSLSALCEAWSREAPGIAGPMASRLRTARLLRMEGADHRLDGRPGLDGRGSDVRG